MAAAASPSASGGAMAEPFRKRKDSPQEAEPKKPSLNQEIRARVKHEHKGDVGMPGTNEEVFQGSKQKELKQGRP
jgi:hypothetical protein